MIFLLILTFLILGVFSYLFVDANLIYLQSLVTNFSTQKREFTSLLFFTIITIQFVCYFFIVKRNVFERKPLASIIKIILVISLFLFLSYPAFLSYDIFNYITTAKVAFFYRENPYVVMPIEFLNEPYLQFTRAANKFALYGPLWILITSVPFFLGANIFVLTLFLFKSIPLSFYFLTLFLIWKMTKSKTNTILFALSPLVLIESLASSHNDIVMMFFALLSFYTFSKGKYFWSVLALFISILIKYATLFLIPVYLYLTYIKLTKQKIIWDRVFLLSFLSMFTVFLCSTFREEIYPWYVIWFFVFVPFITKHKLMLVLSISLSYGMMLRYLPYMFTGNYFGNTPIFKIVLTLVPVVFAMFVYKLGKNIWLKRSFR